MTLYVHDGRRSTGRQGSNSDTHSPRMTRYPKEGFRRREAMIGSLTDNRTGKRIGYSDGMLWDTETGADLSTRHMDAATAEYLATAYDCHDDLLECVTELSGQLSCTADTRGRLAPSQGCDCWACEWSRTANAAIQKARGE